MLCWTTISPSFSLIHTKCISSQTGAQGENVAYLQSAVTFELFKHDARLSVRVWESEKALKEMLAHRECPFSISSTVYLLPDTTCCALFLTLAWTKYHQERRTHPPKNPNKGLQGTHTNPYIQNTHIISNGKSDKRERELRQNKHESWRERDASLPPTIHEINGISIRYFHWMLIPSKLLSLMPIPNLNLFLWTACFSSYMENPCWSTYNSSVDFFPHSCSLHDGWIFYHSLLPRICYLGWNGMHNEFANWQHTFVMVICLCQLFWMTGVDYNVLEMC